MSSAETEAILGHHMELFSGKDLDVLLSDYTEDSVLITAEKTFKGRLKSGRSLRPYSQEYPPNSSPHSTWSNRKL